MSTDESILESDKNFQCEFNKLLFANVTWLYNNIILQLSLFLKCYGMYLVWIVLHYISSHLYIKFCVPYDFVGFFISPIVITTPYCQSLRWVVYNGANVISNMWIVTGAWICANLLKK